MYVVQVGHLIILLLCREPGQGRHWTEKECFTSHDTLISPIPSDEFVLLKRPYNYRVVCLQRTFNYLFSQKKLSKDCTPCFRPFHNARWLRLSFKTKLSYIVKHSNDRVHFTRMLSQFWCPLVALILYTSTTSVAADGYDNEVKCFCDKVSCPGSLVCTGRWCLIGVRNTGDPGRYQLCGSEDDERPPTNCAEGWNKWTEVCACTEHLCNTFAFLRMNMDRQQQDLLSGDGPNSRSRKMDGHTKPKNWYNSNNNQIVLLLIIPLCVGGFLVCLIFLNFHCKMS
uniref:Activin_recp domain-containing protein n=1 Tax=Panagrellus redivivus TaxID=6233 RepID=A0A7E4V2N5_PANRE